MSRDGFDVKYSDGEWLSEIKGTMGYSYIKRPDSPMFTSYSVCLAFLATTKKKFKWYIVRSGSQICREWDERVIFSNDEKHPSYNEFGSSNMKVL